MTAAEILSASDDGEAASRPSEGDSSNVQEPLKKRSNGDTPDTPPERNWGSRSVRLAALAVAVSMVILIVVFAISEPRQGALIGRSTVAQPAPDIEGETINGDFFDLDAHRGRWVVLNFFATWCVGCRVEHPELVKFSSRHKASGDAIVVTIAFDDDPQKVKEFFDTRGGDWPVIAEGVGQTWVDYGVTNVPETYIISPAGYVTDKLVGTYGVTADALDARISDLETAAANARGQERPE